MEQDLFPQKSGASSVTSESLTGRVRSVFLRTFVACVTGIFLVTLATAGQAAASTRWTPPPTCASAPNICPVVTPTEATFTIPAGPAASWELILHDTTGLVVLSTTTTVFNGQLSLPVPNVPGCSFQADVHTGPVGGPTTTPYSGLRTSFKYCGHPVTCQESSFNSTSIPGGDYIWFNAAVEARGVGSSGGTIEWTSSAVKFSVGGTHYTVPQPNGTINFSSSVTTATTQFSPSQNRWIMTVPLGFGGNVFLTGVPFAVPAGGLPGGISPVTWTGSFTLTAVSSVQWQWAAAVYTNLITTPTDYYLLRVKPLLSTTQDAYHNSDQAGTPEAYKSFVTAGATGNGGTNYTGFYSSGRSSCCGGR